PAAAAATGPSTEEQVRRVLRAIPLSRLRDAGLLDSLLELGGAPAAPSGTGDTGDSIDSMGADDLIDLAFGNLGPAGSLTEEGV
ncbi:hypothetical protein, partial [Amycolatopsis sp. SID8362]|uniref:hypothetical protein n=1 Tax=Amycolatopsis sp. SID8362 TaxID=2690346 RepID=UPI00136CA180